MSIAPGSRWKSAVCDTEIVVVRPTKAEGELECGGAPVIPINAARPATGEPSADMAGGTELGKRYGDDEAGLEVLCTKAGKGALAFAGKVLALRGAKRLPSSD